MFYVCQIRCHSIETEQQKAHRQAVRLNWRTLTMLLHYHYRSFSFGLFVSSIVLGISLFPRLQPQAIGQTVDIRNQLLTRLQGQQVNERLQTLLTIIQSDSNVDLRKDAVQFLRGMNQEVPAIGEQLGRQLLVESNPGVYEGLRTLLVESDADIELFLVRTAENANADQQLRIIKILGDLAAGAPESIDFLVDKLASEDPQMLLAACKSLEKAGPPANPALEKLIELAGQPRATLDTSNDRGRAFRAGRDQQGAAIRAIAAIGPDKSALAVLTAALTLEPQIAAPAAEALAKLGPQAISALPELEKLAARDDHSGRDLKTRSARKAAEKAIAAIKSPPASTP